MIGFHYPLMFGLYVLFGIILVLFFWSRWKRRTDLKRLGEWKYIQQLIDVAGLLRRQQKDIVSLLALFILIFSCTGPQFGTRLKEVKQRGVDVFIALDTSRSMLAEDVLPTRMDKAKRSLGLLVRKLEGNRTGIIAFAKEAILQCPLTTDTEASQLFLDVLDTNTVPVQGTSIGSAIRLALNSFPKDEKTGRAIVLLTDGEDHESDPTGAAKEAKDAGVVIFTIGIGTTKGEVIKNRNEQGQVTEFHKHNGEMVVSRLDDAALTKIAAITGGKYYRASTNDGEIDEIADILNEFDKKEFSTKSYERLQERYQCFALIALLLLLIEFFIGERPGQWQRVVRRLNTQILIFFFLFFSSHYARADIKDHVIKGNKLIEKRDFVGARSEFESARIDAPEEPLLPYNIGTSYYLEGKLDDAKREYEQALALAKQPSLKSMIYYNLGHLLFSMNQREEALDKFKECLRLNPKDIDAKYNIEYIKAGHAPSSPPNKSQGEGGQEKSKEQKNKSQDTSQNKDSSQSEKEEQKQKGAMSKENAEQILQMLQSQESEKMKNSNVIMIPKSKPNNKKEEKNSDEDW